MVRSQRLDWGGFVRATFLHKLFFQLLRGKMSTREICSLCHTETLSHPKPPPLWKGLSSLALVHDCGSGCYKCEWWAYVIDSPLPESQQAVRRCWWRGVTWFSCQLSLAPGEPWVISASSGDLEECVWQCSRRLDELRHLTEVFPPSHCLPGWNLELRKIDYRQVLHYFPPVAGLPPKEICISHTSLQPQ